MMLKKILLVSILMLLMQSCIDTENWTGNNFGSSQKQLVAKADQKNYFF